MNWFIILASIFLNFNNALCQFDDVFKNSSHDPMKPLILTPLIKSHQIKEAREKSAVPPFVGSIVSNSGFFTVNETINANLFFWFFQKTSSDWHHAPVLLWLQGGPGCSSMFGLFTENGPYRVINEQEVRLRKYSWTNNYNLLFIDNPIGSGFSFAKHYFVTDETQVADHLYEALLQFFHLYPELGRNEFYLAGESYAGKYIPAIAYKIYKSNPFSKFPINLQGLLIGNGFSDPENMLNSAVHLHRLGLIDYRTKVQMESFEEDTKILIRNGLWENAFSETDHLLSFIKNVTQFKTLYHLIQAEADDDSYLKFIQSKKTKVALHVGQLPYNDCSESVYKNLIRDIPKSIRPWFEELLEQYPILIYNGMLDIIVAHYKTTNFLDSLHWSGAELYSSTRREKWYVGGRLAGYIKVAGNLKYALVRNAGHMVPTNRPRIMLDLADKFIDKEL